MGNIEDAGVLGMAEDGGAGIGMNGAGGESGGFDGRAPLPAPANS